MRIAHICQTYYPMINGQAQMTRQLAEGLSSLGHENLVFSASDRGEPYKTSMSGVKLERARSFMNPLRVGQNFYLWPFNNLISALDNFMPNIIHVHDPLTPALLVKLAKKWHAVPTVITLHQVPRFISAQISNKSLDRIQIEDLLWKYGKWILRNFDHVVAPTATVAYEIKANTGVDASAISNGIDLRIFMPRKKNKVSHNALLEKYGIDPDKPIILHVGQINYEKRVDIVAKAALDTLQIHDGQFLVVGNGTALNSIKSLCEESEVSSKCHFLGYVGSRHELASLYQLSTVFVTASPIETQGLVLLEAAASGLPIVAAAATAIPELVHNNRNGYLVHGNDTSNYVDAILSILKSNRVQQAMGLESYKIAKQHDLRLTVEEYEDLYTRTIDHAKVY